MWKKPSQPSQPSQPFRSTQSPVSELPRPSRQEAPARSSKSLIGSGIVLNGEMRGEEDLVVHGRVEGKIALENHSVFVEESGRVDAEISARTIRIAGEVRGNIFATEQAVLLESARLEGDITAKAVTIETGARFRGSVQMETVSKHATAAQVTSMPEPSMPEPSAAETSAPERSTPETAVSKPNGATSRFEVG